MSAATLSQQPIVVRFNMPRAPYVCRDQTQWAVGARRDGCIVSRYRGRPEGLLATHRQRACSGCCMCWMPRLRTAKA